MFYSEGGEDLREARKEIARWSLPKGQERVDRERKRREERGERVLEKEREMGEYLNSIG